MDAARVIFTAWACSEPLPIFVSPLPYVSACLILKGRIVLFLTAYQHFMPALRGEGSIAWNGKKGSMLRLLNAYGRPATATMDGQLGIPQPKPMELLEGFMVHNSTFHSQSSQVFVLTMAGPTRAQQPKVPGGAGSSYGDMPTEVFCGRQRNTYSSNNSDLAIPRQSKWRQIEQPLSVDFALCYTGDYLGLPFSVARM
ncbi:hypothetical protein TRIATDRAFT_311402 [Trichoderma atroviride IMI 206040]|uniref:Uncharacterized protein n=1 Tax=Hypocrea atroviridis (strain ATCC 20476 / IMI 206040) TaxID=452589 RepID=G9P7R5_HYPAI|nr:uncharacterized protein TRIATDRAFT_311402 [Trichoderma atroviride IMI 206040]EHK40818.1 hypothetical protein TRIATDRAFT_311402 [Trichoderma atroviride IMI 206040]